MAMNLRLRAEAASALRAEAEQTGLSQQEILRRAVDDYLGLGSRGRDPGWPEWIEAPSEPYREPAVLLTLPAGVTSLDLLDATRDERLS
ncbi:MAG: ribbon-helix-helix protein, CopG family [Micrococcales bacterium]|nr:ribbon-helix-helix protein, CopG family [Micrococcales bacterium]OJX67274.1 MAG: hypothetical protein BGO94_00045 [Micrococcales bacterium 72-143]